MMKKSAVIAFVIILLTFSAVFADDRVQVIRIIDGDSVEVQFPGGEKEKVRLIGVNAPELFEPESQARLLAEESRNYAARMLQGKTVELTYDENRFDMYGRTLAFLWIDGVMVNEQMIADGYARAYLKFPFCREYMQAFEHAQDFARKHTRGLWKNPAFQTAGDQDTLHYTSPVKFSDKPPVHIPKKSGGEQK